MLALLSAVVASCCVLASSRRLAWAVAPTSLDARLLADVLQGEDARWQWKALRETVIAAPEPTWERDLFLALADENPRSRDAHVVEQWIELDWASQRWARVPRVCASIATSAGLLFGAIALLRGMAMPREDGSGPAADDALIAALDALTVGIAGTSFCVAVHLRTRDILRQRLRAVERLVCRLQTLAGEASEPKGPVPGREKAWNDGDEALETS